MALIIRKDKMLPKRLINKFIDIDANLLHPDLINNMTYHVDNAKQKNIEMFIVPGSTIEDTTKSLELTKSNPLTYRSTIGIHPYNTQDIAYNSENLTKLENIVKSNTDFSYCIGECGLDYSDGFPDKIYQIPWFKFQLTLAKQYDRCLYLHIRKAHHDFISILEEISNEPISSFPNVSKGKQIVGQQSGDCDSRMKTVVLNTPIPNYSSNKYKYRGVIHCFTGSYEELCIYVELGFYIGITGSIFNYEIASDLEIESEYDSESQKKKELQRIFDTITLGRLLIETDAPYMGFKGCRISENENKDIKASTRKRNATQKYPNLPCALPQIATYISEITTWSIEDIMAATTLNATHIFDIKE